MCPLQSSGRGRGRGGLNLDQTGICHRRLKFTTLFWIGKAQKVYPCSGTKSVNHTSCSGVITPFLKQNYVLYCVALDYIALYCIALHCTALHCTALHCTALHCTALHCTALHCTALHCTALHCIVSYSIVFYCIVLYCRQRSYSYFTYLIKWFYNSTLVLPSLCKRILNFLSLLSV